MASSQRKCYRQRCTVAAALDLLGDRWTLLIVRELLGGPARFQDLLEGLPGVSRNLLTTRLRQLEGDGVIRRLNAPTRYAVTERGRAARSIIDALGHWGAHAERPMPAEHERSARSIAVALQAILSRRSSGEEPVEVLELEVGEDTLEVTLGPRVSVRVGAATDPDARLRTSTVALSDYLDSVSSGDVPLFEVLGGAPGAYARLAELLRVEI